MEKLECVIVHRSMPLVSSLASLSLATPTICAILVMFVTAKWWCLYSILYTKSAHSYICIYSYCRIGT